MANCPNCNSPIIEDSNICIKCGWRPYHGVIEGNKNAFSLAGQNFKAISIISVLLSVVSIGFCFLPLWINIKSPSAEAISTTIIFFSTTILLLYVWVLINFYKYLNNFYHPLDNIFSNLRWYIVSMISVPILISIGTSFQLGRDLDGLFTFLLIGLYVLWAFMQILIGSSLIKAEKYDYIGGLSILGYIMLASGIIPLFFFLIPIFFSNIFIKAGKYVNKLHA